MIRIASRTVCGQFCASYSFWTFLFIVSFMQWSSNWCSIFFAYRGLLCLELCCLGVENMLQKKFYQQQMCTMIRNIYIFIAICTICNFLFFLKNMYCHLHHLLFMLWSSRLYNYFSQYLMISHSMVHYNTFSDNSVALILYFDENFLTEQLLYIPFFVYSILMCLTVVSLLSQVFYLVYSQPFLASLTVRPGLHSVMCVAFYCSNLHEQTILVPVISHVLPSINYLPLYVA